MSDISYIPDPQPFWFADSELLRAVLRAQFQALNLLIAREPGLRSVFDIPDATESQRKLCFIVLAHRKVLDVIFEKFAAHYEQPQLGEEESKALFTTNSLVIGDAPNWVLEMDRVVERLPYHLFDALPQPLHAGGFTHSDAEKSKAVESAAEAFSTVEQIQKLIETVLDQQLEKLALRWSAAVPLIASQSAQSPKKRKGRRIHDEQRKIRDKLIAEIDEVSKTPTEFLHWMDKRDVKPQPTWITWRGSWTDSYKDEHLKTLIHKDKSRAIARVRRSK